MHGSAHARKTRLRCPRSFEGRVAEIPTHAAGSPLPDPLQGTEARAPELSRLLARPAIVARAAARGRRRRLDVHPGTRDPVLLSGRCTAHVTFALAGAHSRWSGA